MKEKMIAMLSLLFIHTIGLGIGHCFSAEDAIKVHMNNNKHSSFSKKSVTNSDHDLYNKIHKNHFNSLRYYLNSASYYC